MPASEHHDTADQPAFSGLSAEGLRDIFPFFFALDRELRLVDHGRSLSKVCSNLEKGAPLSALFTISRPRVKLAYDDLLRASSSTFFLDSVSQKVRMRGQLYQPKQSEVLLFLGAPWFTDLEALQNTQLALSDFTVHDPIVDFLYMVKAKSIALADAQKFSETVSKQRDELIAVNSQLELAMAAKSQFLANTSHELRTPLNGIIGMASLLTRMKLSSQQRHFAETILRSGRTLLGVVNDILDISKIEAGRMTLEQIDFNLHRLIAETIDGIAVTAHTKGLELIYAIEKDVPVWLLGDPMRLAQVLTNLLGNAVKFTTRGEVAVRVCRTPAPAPEIGLRITVRDTGIGIASGDLPLIFKPFSQADTSMSRRFGGTGLGLALCREIAHLMGGEIGVNSAAGVGSEFSLDARLRPPLRVHTPLPKMHDGLLARQRVLAVDDNASSRMLLQDLITSWNGACDTVDSAEHALAALHAAMAEDRPYEVLLLDTHMPGMSGPELVAVLAADPLFDDLLLVMLSPPDPEGRKHHPQRHRVSAYLSKPLHPQALSDCLADLVRAQRHKVRVLPLSHAGESGDAIVPIDPNAELPSSDQCVLVVDDNPVNLEVAARMLEALGYRADVVSSGAEALRATEKKPYALILMDLQMPGVSGYEATATLRARQSAGQRLPIIAMTAHAMPADRQRALAAGMDDYISKPIEVDTLAQLMSQWLPGAVPSSEVAVAPIAPPTAPAATTTDADIIDRSAFAELRKFQPAGGEDLVAKVVRTYLTDLAERTRAARLAMAQGDVRALGRIGHALKSSSKLVGAREFSKLCAELEQCAESTDRASLEVLLERFLFMSTRVEQALAAQVGGAAPAV